MEAIIKGYFGVFMTVMTIAIGMAIISSSIDQRNANSMAILFATRIQAAGYAQETIEECKEEASALGYSLDVQTEKIRFGYTYSLPVLGISRDMEIYVPLS